MDLFIGSSTKENIEPLYFDDCGKLISDLAEIKDVNLIFDGCHTGLMGRCYDEFKNNKKKIVGILMSKQKELNQENNSYDKEVVVETAMEKFGQIYINSDILLFLPGGVEVYAEIFLAIEENRIGKGKKIILYNDNYFYTPIIKELYKLYENGFIDLVPASYMTIESDRNKIIEIIKEEMD